MQERYKNWRVEKRKITELKKLKKNPRQLNKDMREHLEKSLSKFGLCDLPVINTDNTVIGGHQRLKVLKDMGVKEVSVLIPDETLTDHDVEELNIRLNKNVGEWDWDKLANEWEIADLVTWGFSLDELDIDINVDEIEDNQEDIHVPKKTNIKIGDVISINNHVIYCNDSKKINFNEINNKTLCFTDPPYDMKADELIEIIKNTKCFHIILITTFKQGAGFYAKEQYKFHFDFVINAKVPKSFMNRKQPYYTHQNGLYFSKNDETIFSNDYAKNKRSDSNSENGYWHTVIEAPRQTNQSHGHAKNLRGMLDILSGFKYETILDPFLGGGTSLICAEMLNKNFIGSEIDPINCQISCDKYLRHMKEKGKKVTIQINGEEVNFEVND